ncbi:MAG TPA: AgmX/PglI C-terminal domain-containing protein [Steroidobacteraceae bacterium]|nr:AgmX/PglI C-terminal domain-containing protein [Steroidobacteraceae bacterium]
MVLAPYYRRYELPWEEDREENHRFRRLMLCALVLFLLFAAILPWIPRPAVRQAAPEVPERLARLMVQERPQPPPPPKPVEAEKPREEPRPVPPEQRVDQARKKAEKQLSHVRDELADLRREFASDLPQTRDLTTGRIDAQASSDRSLIVARAGAGSAGVASADSSRGFGGGAGALGTHAASAVNSTVAAIAGADKPAAGANGKGKRGQEGFEEEFDRNKGALYALYTRALRERPELQGKLVLEVTVSPAGDVTACRVVSSELGDDELEHKIVARVKLIHFPAGDFLPTTFVKPIEFFPG